MLNRNIAPIACLLFVVGVPSSCRSVDADLQNERRAMPRVSVHLRDSSHLIGRVEQPLELALHTEFGNVTVPLKLLSHVLILQDQETAQLFFQNEDRLSGVLDAEAVKLTTTFGVVSVPFAAMTRMEMAGFSLTDLRPPSTHCVDFTNGGCLVLGLPADALNGDAATYEAWIKPRDARHEGILIWDGNDRAGFDRIFSYSRGRLRVFFQFTPSVRAAPSTLIPIGVWSHVAFVIRGDSLTIYVNGGRVAKRATRIPRHQSTSALSIGRGFHLRRPYDTQFYGKMTDVKVWARALSSEELSRSARGAKVDHTGLLGHWNFARNAYGSIVGMSNNPITFGDPKIVPLDENDDRSDRNHDSRTRASIELSNN